MIQTVQANEWLILEQPDGFHRIVHAKPGTRVDLSKFGKIHADDLFGKPYEATLEITKDGLELCTTADPTETAAPDGDMLPNNQIFDSNTSQKLSHEQIIQLREQLDSGHLHSKQLIDAVVANSGSFDKKNSFAQIKYRQRKESKFARWIRLKRCDIYNLCDFYTLRDPERVGFLRIDTLSQMLCVGNVFEGQSVMCLDDTRGLLLGSVASLNQRGMTIPVYSGRYFQPYLYEHFNLPDSLLFPLESALLLKDTPVPEPAQNSTERYLEKHQALLRTVDAVRRQQVDSLLIALVDRKLDRQASLEPMLQTLRPSSSVVIFAPYLDFLSDLFAWMMSDPRFVDVRLSEPWMREYQTAAGRCHPKMSMNGHGGCLLSACYILP